MGLTHGRSYVLMKAPGVHELWTLGCLPDTSAFIMDIAKQQHPPRGRSSPLQMPKSPLQTISWASSELLTQYPISSGRGRFQGRK